MSNYFGTGRVAGHTAEIEVPVYEGFVAPTGDALMQIATEGVLEGAQLQAALHIADATIAYTAVKESTEAAEVVLEGVIGSTVGKIKEGLKKLWSKIKAWFASVKKSISVMFSKGKDFVSKYKKEIESKPARGFEYEGYAWSISAGNGKFTSASNGLTAAVEKIVGSLSNDVDKFTSHAMGAAGDAKAATEYETSDLQEEIVKGIGMGTEISDIKEELSKAYRGGKEEKEELKEFAKVTRGALMDLIKDVDKNIKVITDAEKNVDKTFTTALKALDKVESAIGKKADSEFGADKGRAKATTLASKMGAAVRYAQGVNSALAATAVDSIKASASEAESVLKSFVRFKGVKESFNTIEEEGASNVMESLISRVGF